MDEETKILCIRDIHVIKKNLNLAKGHLKFSCKGVALQIPKTKEYINLKKIKCQSNVALVVLL